MSCQDEAEAYQAIPQAGVNWHQAAHPKGLPHEYMREGTAKLLTLFRPKTGEVRPRASRGPPMSSCIPGSKKN